MSDFALLKPLPEAVRADLEALVGCIAGAELVETTREQACAAGLTDVELDPKPQYVAAMGDWQDPLYRKIAEQLPAGESIAEYVVSLDVRARR